MLRIYHNPRCSKSRQALQLIQESGARPEIYEYLDQGFEENALRAMIGKLSDPVAELIRRNENEFKTLGLADKELDTNTVVDALLTQPKLLQRPVIETADRAIIARPPERAAELLE